MKPAIFRLGLVFAMLTSASSIILFAAGGDERGPTLTVWHPFPEETHFIQHAAEVWNTEHPEKFQVEPRFIPFGDLKREITQSLVTGEVPDIAMVDNPDHASFAASGAFYDLSEWIEAWGQADEYFPGPWNSTIWQGRNYGVPIDSNTILLYYNRDAFARVGLDAPPQTWAELRAYAEALTNPDENFRGIAFSAVRTEEGTFQFLPFVQQAGGSIDAVNGPGGVAALGLWSDLVEGGYATPEVVNMTQNEAVGLLAGGNAAMAISGPWSLGLMDAVDFDWGLALLPIVEDVGVRSSALGGYNMAIMAMSDNPEDAWEFITWLQLPENIRRFYWDYLGGARIPSRADIADEPGRWVEDERLRVFIEQLRYAAPRGPHPRWPAISEAIQVAIQKALTGQASPQEALDEAAAAIAEVY